MQPDRTAELRTLLNRRILILDGAMGTMIQTYKLSEAQFRGERFKDWPSDVRGNNDLLSLTQPQIIDEITGSIWKPARTSSRPTPSTRTHRPWPITAWKNWCTN